MVRAMFRSIRAAKLELVLLLTVLFVLTSLESAFAQETAPPLELSDSAGQVRKLEDYRGKIVVLNFWATWCGPCASEMSRFVETHQRYASKNVVVLAASLDAEETKKNIPAFMQKHKIEFPVLVGATLDQLHQFGMGDGLPGTVFLDPDGHIFARIIGEANKKDIFARVDWLLGDHTGKEPKATLGKPMKAK
jgi:peroxiredoxin